MLASHPQRVLWFESAFGTGTEMESAPGIGNALGIGSVLETGHASENESVSRPERIAGFPPGWSPLEWAPVSLPSHSPDSPSGRES